jgi:hypothetical protein
MTGAHVRRDSRIVGRRSGACEHFVEAHESTLAKGLESDPVGVVSPWKWSVSDTISNGLRHGRSVPLVAKCHRPEDAVRDLTVGARLAGSIVSEAHLAPATSYHQLADRRRAHVADSQSRVSHRWLVRRPPPHLTRQRRSIFQLAWRRTGTRDVLNAAMGAAGQRNVFQVNFASSEAPQGRSARPCSAISPAFPSRACRAGRGT